MEQPDVHKRPKPVVLAILDGWGHSEADDNNAIKAAHTPTWDGLLQHFPHGLIHASESHVGLPDGQMGNSEVGHMNIGSGRAVLQDLPRIDQSIAKGTLQKKAALEDFINTLRSTGGTCHVMGLVSPGGVHSHQEHIVALIKILHARKIPVCIHAFLDGRDTPPKSGLEYMQWLSGQIEGLENVRFASVSGRYYAMDRDKRWDRVQSAYDAMVSANAPRYSNAVSAVELSYKANITDEFFEPCVIGEYAGMREGDGLLMANFRADRVRQLLTALLDETFDGFDRNRSVSFAGAVGMTEYSSKLAGLMTTLFSPESLEDILGEVVAAHGLKQLRIAETEKYAHVTFFFNGGREQEFTGEDRILVPSPKVATYDLQPEMSAQEVTDKLVDAIKQEQYDFIVVNYANTDMVGHTGNIKAAIKAVETVDHCLGRLTKVVLDHDGAMLITADHGNAEQMFDAGSGQSHTAHTLNLVPVIILSAELRDEQVDLEEGALADIAPTLLQLMGLPQPEAMTGQSLLADYA